MMMIWNVILTIAIVALWTRLSDAYKNLDELQAWSHKHIEGKIDTGAKRIRHWWGWGWGTVPYEIYQTVICGLQLLGAVALLLLYAAPVIATIWLMGAR